MTTDRHYARAPIKEALIDIRVTLPDDITLETLSDLAKSQRARYPRIESRYLFQVEGQPGSDMAISAKQTQLGYIAWQDDKKQAFQVRLDGFSFSRLAPYENWIALRDEARRLWELYYEVAQPEAITRIAVRYINHINLPLPFGDFKDYLCTVPEIAPELPQHLSSYFMQLKIPQADLDALLVLNQGILPQEDPNTLPMLLDIDLFREVDIAPDDENSLWSLFEDLHRRKNKIFEACITNRTRELIS